MKDYLAYLQPSYDSFKWIKTTLAEHGFDAQHIGRQFVVVPSRPYHALNAIKNNVDPLFLSILFSDGEYPDPDAHMSDDKKVIEGIRLIKFRKAPARDKQPLRAMKNIYYTDNGQNTFVQAMVFDPENQ